MSWCSLWWSGGRGGYCCLASVVLFALAWRWRCSFFRSLNEIFFLFFKLWFDFRLHLMETFIKQIDGMHGEF